MATLYGENTAADFDDKLGNCVYLSRLEKRRRDVGSCVCAMINNGRMHG